MVANPARRGISAKVVILIALGAGALCLVGGAWFAVQATTVLRLHIGYPGITMSGYYDQIVEIHVTPEKFKADSHPVFVVIDGLPVRALGSLREEDIQSSDAFRKVVWGKGVERRGTSYKDGRGNMCTFEDGKLNELNIFYAPSKTFRFGSSEDGPFFSVPMSESDVEKAFGPPREIEHNRVWRSPYPW